MTCRWREDGTTCHSNNPMIQSMPHGQNRVPPFPNHVSWSRFTRIYREEKIIATFVSCHVLESWSNITVSRCIEMYSLFCFWKLLSCGNGLSLVCVLQWCSCLTEFCSQYSPFPPHCATGNSMRQQKCELDIINLTSLPSFTFSLFFLSIKNVSPF